MDLAMHTSWQVQDFVDVEVQSWWPVAGAGLFVGLEAQISWQV